MVDPTAPITGGPIVYRIPGFSTIIPHPKQSCVTSDRFAAIDVGSQAPALARLSPPLSFHDPRSRQG